MREETQIQSGQQATLKDVPAAEMQELTPEQAEQAKGGIGPVDGIIQPGPLPFGPVDGKR